MIAALESQVTASSEGTGRLKKTKQTVRETCCCGLGIAVASVQPLNALWCAQQAADPGGQQGML